MSATETFAVLYRPGPRWSAELPFHKQDGVMAHRDFLAAQHAAGALIVGGPFLDDTGGLAVYAAASRADLERALAEDPTVAGGLLRYEIHPYAVAFARMPD